jgi:hypothetical protein
MLIDEFMPSYDVVERHEALINAPPTRVYAALRTTDFARARVVKLLLALRALPSWLLESKTPRRKLSRKVTLDTFLTSGFVLLSEAEGEEIVLGLVGRFWTPTGRLEKTDPVSFRQESRAGLARAAWNFTLEPVESGTRVFTETRVKCTDSSSRARFLSYWVFVRPFSGLIRRCMLRELRLESEQASAAT